MKQVSSSAFRKEPDSGHGSSWLNIGEMSLRGKGDCGGCGVDGDGEEESQRRRKEDINLEEPLRGREGGSGGAGCEDVGGRGAEG